MSKFPITAMLLFVLVSLENAPFFAFRLFFVKFSGVFSCHIRDTEIREVQLKRSKFELNFPETFRFFLEKAYK